MGFKLQSDKKESENKTIRFPLDVVEGIESAIVGKEVTFSGFVIQACKYCLKELEETKTEKEQSSLNKKQWFKGAKKLPLFINNSTVIRYIYNLFDRACKRDVLFD